MGVAVAVVDSNFDVVVVVVVGLRVGIRVLEKNLLNSCRSRELTGLIKSDGA